MNFDNEPEKHGADRAELEFQRAASLDELIKPSDPEWELYALARILMFIGATKADRRARLVGRIKATLDALELWNKAQRAETPVRHETEKPA